MHNRIPVVELIYNFHIESGGGGIARAAIDIAENLDREKFDVQVLALGDNGTEAEQKWIFQLNQAGIRAAAITPWDESHPYRSFFNSYRALRNLFSKEPAAIIHSHSEFTDITAIFLKLQRVIPAALRTVHYGFAVEWMKRPLRRALLTNLLYPILFDAEVGINPSMVERLNGRWAARLLRKKAVFISGAIPIERYSRVKIDRGKRRTSLGVPSDALLIGCVGRLVEQKGYMYYIQAAETVIRQEPRAYFLVVGDGPLKGELQAQVDRLGLSNQIIFTGSRSDVEEILACLDLYAIASLWEGFPISVMESMAGGVPVVATDIPGSRDLIQHRENGWLVPPRNPEAFAEAILTLLNDPGTRKKLAQKATESVQQYSSASISNRYGELYEKLSVQKN